MPTTPRVRAPELRGRGWLNTDGPLTLGDLRGRFVLLDFWTFCCINCLHVLDEMREVEEKYDGELVVVGVHSPKFEHEADPDALAAAVERYDVRHPVLDDPELVTWQAYTARAWPTLVLVDPEGYVVAQYAGEGHAHAIDALVGELREEHRAAGTLQPGDSPYVAPPVPEGDLRFPAKAVALPGGTFLVADAGHHSLVELADDLATVVRRIGSADRGLVDGDAGTARFNEPNGLCLLPDDVAAAAGYDVVVADTVNHALRGVRLDTGEVRTLAGDGHQWMQGVASASLSSPWDVTWWQGLVWVAMAGIHQLWTFDPATGDVRVAAGTTHEGLVDGPAAEAWFAQTSGFAATADRLWLADSETSSLRFVADGAGRHRRGPRAVRLRLHRRPRSRRAAPAPARRRRAARRLGGGRGHLQRRGPPLRPGHRHGRHPGRPASRSRAACSSTETTSWWWSPRRTGCRGCRSARRPVPRAARTPPSGR